MEERGRKGGGNSRLPSQHGVLELMLQNVFGGNVVVPQS